MVYINHFKVCSSVAFSTFTMLYICHLYLVLRHFHHRKRKPRTIKQSLPIISFLPLVASLHSVFVDLPILVLDFFECPAPGAVTSRHPERD